MAYRTVSTHVIVVAIITAYLPAKERKRTYPRRLEARRK